MRALPVFALGALLAIGAATVSASQIPNVTTTPSHTFTQTPSPTPTPTITPTQTPPPSGTPAPTPAPAASSQIFVNTTTAGDQFFPAVAIGADESFIVAWTSDAQDGDDSAVIARRFDKTGAPLGGEFQVNVSTTGFQYLPAIASDPAGNFVVVWTSSPAYGESDVFGRRYDAGGNALGGEFPVNTYTTDRQLLADVAMNADGFMVVWSSFGQDGDENGVYARRYASDGTPEGVEFQVNTYTTGYQSAPRVSMGTNRSVVVWQSQDQDGDGSGVYGQLYQPDGNPIGGEFAVNTLTTGSQVRPAVSMGDGGDFIVAWSDYDTGGSSVFARGFNAAGDALGPDFQVSANEAYPHPRVAKLDSLTGGFVVAWSGHAPGTPGSAPNGPPPQQTSIYAQRFDNAPFPTAQFYLLQQPPRRGSTFRVDTDAPFSTLAFPDVAIAPDGRFVVAWQSLHQDLSAHEIVARRFAFPEGGVLEVDQRASGGTSNLNGVLEPGERVTIDPSWTNSAPAAAPLTLTGNASNVTGPAGPTYTLDDGFADYGTIAEGATNDCFTATGNCYEVSVSETRPVQHWDATFDEALASPGPLGPLPPLSKTWALHVGGSFADVPQDAFYPFIENLFHNRVTGGGGCGAGLYCGEDGVLRQQMAVFLLKAAYGADFTPPSAAGDVFDDVPASSPFAPWIEELARIGVTAGCTSPPPPALPSYCPTNPVNRQQMAVFLMKTWLGTNFTPGSCTGIFDDVDCLTNPFAPWIELLAYYQIAGGCQAAPPLYCPTDATRRKQMAVFLVKTFGLQLYGPD